MAGVNHVGVTSAIGNDIRVDIGRVWLSADGKRARIATHEVGGLSAIAAMDIEKARDAPMLPEITPDVISNVKFAPLKGTAALSARPAKMRSGQ